MYNPNQGRFQSAVGSRGGGARGRGSLSLIAKQVNWTLLAGFLAVLAVSLYATDLPRFTGWATFVFVLVGWLFSLTLHEWSHAAVAFVNGDQSVTTYRYLSGNPLDYINPLLSIILPLLFVLIGGIGLPGAAVVLQTNSVYGKWRRSAIAAAGPAANLVVLLLLVVLYRLGLTYGFLGVGALAAVAFLAFLQGTAILLNLIPIPGLDGYGVIEPHLSYQTRQSFEAIRPYGFIILFALLWLVPAFNTFFFGIVTQGVGLLGFSPFDIFQGFTNFRFWIPQ